MKKILCSIGITVSLLVSANVIAGCATTCDGVPQSSCNSNYRTDQDGGVYGCYWETATTQECTPVTNPATGVVTQECSTVDSSVCMKGKYLGGLPCNP